MDLAGNSQKQYLIVYKQPVINHDVEGKTIDILKTQKLNETLDSQKIQSGDKANKLLDLHKIISTEQKQNPMTYQKLIKFIIGILFMSLSFGTDF